MQPKRIALLVRKLVNDKKAEYPVILDIGKFTTIAHYFVITHGNSERHVRAIANHVKDSMKDVKVPLWHVEGMEDGRWVVLDYGTVIAHIFYRDRREFYGLERLWGEATHL